MSTVGPVNNDDLVFDEPVRPLPTKEERDARELVELRDRAVTTRFVTWIRHRDDAHCRALAEFIDRVSEDGQVVLKRLQLLELLNQAEDETLLDAYLLAEAEYRVETLAMGRTGQVLELDPAARFTFRDPTQQSSLRCKFPLGRTGQPCNQPSIPGTTRCRRHGGELVDISTRRAVLMSAYLELVGAADLAVRTLVHVAENGRNELARVAAAKEILDRAGLTPELHVSISVEQPGEDRFSSLMERLDQMQQGLRGRPAIEASAAETATEV